MVTSNEISVTIPSQMKSPAFPRDVKTWLTTGRDELCLVLGGGEAEAKLDPTMACIFRKCKIFVTLADVYCGLVPKPEL